MFSCLHRMTNHNSQRWLWAVALFIITYSIRVLFIIESNSRMIAFNTPVPGMDIDLYWQAARLIGQGECADGPCFELMMCSSPAYVYWLSTLQGIFGPSMFWLRLINALVVSTSAVLLYYLILQITQRLWIAVTGGLAWAIFPSLIFFDAMLYKSSLGILVLLGMLVFVSLGKRSVYPLALILTGALLASVLLMLLQGSSFFISFAILIYICFDPRIDRKKSAALVVGIGMAFVMQVFFLQNKSSHQKPIFTKYLPQTGIHFNIGFNEQANGAYVKIKGVHSWPYGHNFQARIKAEVDLGRHLSPKEADQYYTDKALAYIAAHPVDAVWLVVKKAALFFNNYEIKGADNLSFAKEKSRVLSMSPLGLGILVMLSAVGLCYLVKKRRFGHLTLLLGILLAVLLSNLMIFVTWRYRIFNIVPLFLLASFGLLSIQECIIQLKNGAKPVWARWIAFAAAVLIPMVLGGMLTYLPLVGNELKAGYYRISLQNEKLSRDGKRRMEKLQQMDRVASEDNSDLVKKALLLSKLHRYSASFKLLEKLWDRQVYQFRGVRQHVVYLMWLGEYDRARALVKDASKDYPYIMSKLEKTFRGVERRAYKKFVRNVVGDGERLNR